MHSIHTYTLYTHARTYHMYTSILNIYMPHKPILHTYSTHTYTHTYMCRVRYQYTGHHPPHLYTGRRRRRYTTHARLITTC